MPDPGESSDRIPTRDAVIGWGLIALVTAAIFIGVLTLKPKEKAR